MWLKLIAPALNPSLNTSKLSRVEAYFLYPLLCPISCGGSEPTVFPSKQTGVSPTLVRISELLTVRIKGIISAILERWRNKTCLTFNSLSQKKEAVGGALWAFSGILWMYCVCSGLGFTVKQSLFVAGYICKKGSCNLWTALTVKTTLCLGTAALALSERH